MNTRNFTFPISGYIKLSIDADTPEQLYQIIEKHKREIIPKFPNMFIDIDFDNPVLDYNDNENVNENKIQETES